MCCAAPGCGWRQLRGLQQPCQSVSIGRLQGSVRLCCHLANSPHHALGASRGSSLLLCAANGAPWLCASASIAATAVERGSRLHHYISRCAAA